MKSPRPPPPPFWKPSPASSAATLSQEGWRPRVGNPRCTSGIASSTGRAMTPARCFGKFGAPMAAPASKAASADEASICMMRMLPKALKAPLARSSGGTATQLPSQQPMARSGPATLSDATSPITTVTPDPSSGQKPPTKSSKSSTASLYLQNESVRRCRRVTIFFIFSMPRSLACLFPKGRDNRKACAQVLRGRRKRAFRPSDTAYKAQEPYRRRSR